MFDISIVIDTRTEETRQFSKSKGYFHFLSSVIPLVRFETGFTHIENRGVWMAAAEIRIQGKLTVRFVSKQN